MSNSEGVVRGRGKLVHWGMAACVVTLLAASFLMLTSAKPDRFRFLNGHRPHSSGVLLLYGIGYHHKFTDEYLIYSWKQPFQEAVAVISAELTAEGFSVAKRGGGVITWKRSDEYGVMAFQGRSRSRNDAAEAPDLTSEWVTVMTVKPIPRNWISHLRYVLEPSD